MTLLSRLVTLIVLATLPAVIVQVWSTAKLRSQLIQNTRDEVQRAAERGASDLDRIAEGARQFLSAIAEAPPIRAQDAASCTPYLQRLNKDTSAYLSLGADQLDGSSLCTSSGTAAGAYSNADRAFHRRALETGRFAVGDYVIGAATKKQSIHFALPYQTLDGATAGVVLVGIDLSWLAKQLNVPPKMRLQVRDRNGVILVRLPEDSESWVGRKRPFRQIKDADTNALAIGQGPDGTRRLFARAEGRENTLGLAVAVGVDEEAVLAPLNDAAWHSALLILVGFVTALVAALVAGTRSIRRPVAALLAASTRLEHGDLSARSALANDASEFGRLGTAFDRMAGAIARREGERDKALADLTNIRAELESRVLERTRESELAMARAHQLEKMDSLGQLTGGVAHDFNNLLMAVMGSLTLLRKRMSPEDARAIRLIDNAMQGAERGAALTKRMLAFARRQELKPEPIDLAALVRGMLDLIGRSIGPGVRVVTDLPDNLPMACADENQIELALLNLAVNARDAMPFGGSITMTVSHVDEVPKEATREADFLADPEGYLVLAVCDTGTGMDDATLKRATEPFFTTKGPSKGTGLGLSMVRGLAEQSGGALQLISRTGQGTEVRLFLPALDKTAVAINAPHERLPETQTHSLLKGRKILLVDDDQLVLSSTSSLLDDLGMRVTEASSGREALQILASQGPFDVLLSDVAMPGMTGLELAKEAFDRWPALPIILATGYQNTEMTCEIAHQRLSKPYEQSVLAEIVLNALTIESTGADVIVLQPNARHGHRSS